MRPAFLTSKLEKNENLTVLELGSPRNEYLINHNTETEWLRIQRKYLFTNDKNIKYVLYCPTWRQIYNSWISTNSL